MSQVCGRGEEAKLGVRELAHEQRRVLERAGADCQIEPLLDEVHDARSERNLDTHGGVGSQERRHNWCQGNAEIGGRGEPDQTARNGAERGRGLLRLLQPRKRVARPLVVGAAGVGEGELAGGPLQEPDPQLRLERGHAAADGRLADAQRPGSCGKTPGLDHPPEHGDPVEIHSCSARINMFPESCLVPRTATV